eukprot:maker-scaffold_15-snap-gene-9.62-mRNA-1 protein AED:0.00 eAED:0.00 QI:33/1/0.8/1/1/1/5/40/1012
MEKIQELKQGGNVAFSNGDYIQSKAMYKQGIESCCQYLKKVAEIESEPGATVELKTLTQQISFIKKNKSIFKLHEDILSLTISFLSNTAASCLKLEEFDLTVILCDAVLSIEDENVKALYRKAKSYEKLGKLEEASYFCKILLTVSPKNKAGQELMLSLKSTVEDKNSMKTKALDMLNSVINNFESSTEFKEADNKALQQILGSLLDDEMLARQLCAAGLTQKMWLLKETYLMAAHILKKLIDIDGCAKFVLEVLSVKEVFSLFQRIEANEKEVSEGEKDLASVLLSIAVFLAIDFSEDESLKEKFQNSVVSTCLKLCAMGLQVSHRELRRSSIECLIKFVDDNKEKAKLFVEEFEGLSSLLAVLNPVKSSVDKSEEEEVKELRNRVQQVAIVLGKLLPILDDDKQIRTLGVKFCVPMIESIDIYDHIKGCSALLAICIANPELGQAILVENSEGKDTGDLLDKIMRISHTAPAKTQGLICEILANMANNEKGRRVLLGSEDIITTLNMFSQSDSINVKTNAAITLAKLNAMKMNMNPENASEAEVNQNLLIISSVFNLLNEKSTDEEKSKGVEAISYVINDTDIKMAITGTAAKKSNNQLDILKTLVKLITKDKEASKAGYAFGIAHIFLNLSMSEDDKRRDKLREMEVTSEQWEQFEKLTKQQTNKTKADPKDYVEKRIRAFVDADGPSALRALVLNGGSQRVRSCVARTFCNIATVQDVRGKLFSQGCAKALIDLSLSQPQTEIKKMDKPTRDDFYKMKLLGGHALAKMFITTDPNHIPNSTLMDSIKPLVNNLKVNDEDLVSFETAMALTNISTVSEETRRKIISLGAVKFLEYTTYNEDLLVRRAACECICNLASEPEVIEWFCAENHMKLWLIFAGAYEDDLKTSEACLGALAGISHLPEIAKAVEKVEISDPDSEVEEKGQKETGLLTLVVLMMSEELSLVHRTAVCIISLMESLEDGIEKFRRLRLEASIEKALASDKLNLAAIPQIYEIIQAIQTALELKEAN